MKRTAIAMLIIGGLLPAFGQFGQFGRDISRRATIRGGGGDWGKCTIEVEVDHVAEVIVSGDEGRIRTLEGQPSTWRRFDCSSPIPSNVSDFRFRGIDGRGRVDLVRDPRNNRGVAVVRIEDSKGGREGYTFDLEWRGGNFYPGQGGGFGRDRYDDRDYNRDRGAGYGRGRGNYGMEEAVRDCQAAVSDRLARDGVRDLRFRNTNADDRPGRNDYVIGTVNSRRGGDFEFGCSVDFQSGRVRSVDVRRR